MNEYADLQLFPTLYSVISSLRICPVSLLSPEGINIKASYLTDEQSRSHTHFRLIWVEEGEGWHQINNRELWAVSGSLFLITPDDTHDSSGLDGTKYWNIVFEADLSTTTNWIQAEVSPLKSEERLLISLLRTKEIEERHFQVTPNARPNWIARLQQLKFELSYAPPGFTSLAQLLLILLLWDAVKLAKPQLNQCSTQSHQLLASVFCFIQENYQNGISLCDVAKVVGRSPTYLTDLMRRETGQTVLNWIIEYRLSEARRLLLSTNESVEQIAKLLGYPDTGYFIRQFRKHVGVPPKTWKQSQLSTHIPMQERKIG